MTLFLCAVVASGFAPLAALGKRLLLRQLGYLLPLDNAVLRDGDFELGYCRVAARRQTEKPSSAHELALTARKKFGSHHESNMDNNLC